MEHVIEEIGLDVLPQSWRVLKVIDVCESILGGGTPSTKNEEYWSGNIPWISSADIYGIKDVRPRRGITIEAVENSTTNILPKGGIIVVTRVGLGKLAVAPYDLCFSQDSQGLILKDELITTEYALLVLQQNVQIFKQQSRGTTISGVTKKQLAELEIPVPPLDVQQQIVSKIEELFSELDKGIEELKTAQQQLKVYRRAVLKWAFEGKLTNENVKEGELPEGWSLQKIEAIAECLDNKRKPVNKAEREARKGDIPYYGANGRTGWIDDYLFDEPLILVVEDETFVGRELPFSYKITGKSWVNNHAHILKPKSGVLFDFLNYQLFYYPFLEIVTGTTGRKKLTKKALMNAQLKICSIDEQVRTVEEIERRLSICEKIEGTIKSSIKQAETLRQSILKNVFG